MRIVRSGIFPVLMALCFLFNVSVTQAQDPQLMVAAGHAKPVSGIAVTRDGRLIITSSPDNTVILWDSGTGRQLKVFHPGDEDLVTDDSAVSNICLSNDEQYLMINSSQSVAGYGSKGPVVLRIKDLTKKINLESGITIYSPDGKYIAGCDNFGGLRVYDGVSLGLLHQYNIFDSNPLAGVNLFDKAISTNKEEYEKKMTAVIADKEKEFDKVHNELSSVQFSPDSKQVVTSGQNNKATLWNIQTGKKTDLTGHTNIVNYATFSPDGKWVVTASTDHTVRFWSAASGALQRTINVNFPASKVIFSPRSQLLILPVDGDSSFQPAMVNISNGSVIATLNEQLISNAFFNSDGSILFTQSRDGSHNSKIWDGTTFTQKDNGPEITNFQFSAGNKYVVTTSGENVTLWDAVSMKQLKELQVFSSNGKIQMAAINNDNKMVITTDRGSGLLDLNSVVADNSTQVKLPAEQQDYHKDNSPDGKYRYELTQTDNIWAIHIINNADNKMIATFNKEKDPTLLYRPAFFSPDSKLVALPFNAEHSIRIVDLSSGKTVNTLSGFLTNLYQPSLFSPDSKYIVIAQPDQDTPAIIDVLTGKVKSKLEQTPGVNSNLLFSPPNPSDPDGGKYLATLGININLTNFHPMSVLQLWETATGKLLSKISDDQHPFEKFLFSPDAKYLFTDNGESIFKQWDVSTGAFLSEFHPGKDGSGSFQLAANGYYRGDKNVAATLYYVTKDFKIVGADQLDIRYNRPDKVLEATNSADTELKNSYQKAYLARLASLHMDSTAVNSKAPLPELTILNEDNMAAGETYALHIRAADHTATLGRLNVWINNVPLYGRDGLLLRGKRKLLDTTLNMPLSAWASKHIIRASVINSAGVESYRAELALSGKERQNANTTIYFVGIGMNHFADAGNNLSWSINDIRSLASALKKSNTGQVIIDTLFDKKMTQAALDAIKERLKKLGTNDRVIVAYSGHGLLIHKNLYFPTWATNFSMPEKTSIAYSGLEELLDNIAPRQKLLLIDACNSGDYDKDGTAGLSRPAILSKNSVELMRDIFVNPEKGTGATIIASSGLNSPSMANSVSKHGLLINGVLEAVTGNAHYLDFLAQNGKNINYKWKVSTLTDYVNKRVPELSGYLQQPVVRSDNPDSDWDISNQEP